MPGRGRTGDAKAVSRPWKRPVAGPQVAPGEFTLAACGPDPSSACEPSRTVAGCAKGRLPGQPDSGRVRRMTDARRPDRYDVSGNPEAEFVDAEQTVLVNLRSITDLNALQIAEEEALAKAYETLLSQVRTDTPLTTELIRHVHAEIFGGLFSWAGRWRTVQISKPGAIWPSAQYLDQSMSAFERDVLRKHRPDVLTDDYLFCLSVAEIQGEFLSIHPFREGNARTIKLATDLFAVQSGRPLLAYDDSPDGAAAYIAAASAALHKRDYSLLERVIREALLRARGR